MGALIKERDTSEVSNRARTLSLPVKGNTVIYQGALVALDTNGFAIPGTKKPDLRAAGRAEETVFNTGADGEKHIKVSRGVFIWDNSSANKITETDLLTPCYIEDDQTVGKLSTGASVAGLVIGINEDGVIVETSLPPVQQAGV